MSRKILVIDDDFGWRGLLKRLFSNLGYDTHIAVGRDDGIRLAEEHCPSCILLDFHLKDGDAIDVCAALKRDDGRPKFPVIIISSDPEAEIRAYGECRADYFVLKGTHTITELTRIVSKGFGDRGRAISLEPGN